jgi:hypothetical protein
MLRGRGWSEASYSVSGTLVVIWAAVAENAVSVLVVSDLTQRHGSMSSTPQPATHLGPTRPG